MPYDTEPFWKHDCDQCVFLGGYMFGTERNDLYFCDQSIGGPTLICRFYDEGSAYRSGLCFAKVYRDRGEIDHPYVVAEDRAIERGLLPALSVKENPMNIRTKSVSATLVGVDLPDYDTFVPELPALYPANLSNALVNIVKGATGKMHAVQSVRFLLRGYYFCSNSEAEADQAHKWSLTVCKELVEAIQDSLTPDPEVEDAMNNHGQPDQVYVVRTRDANDYDYVGGVFKAESDALAHATYLQSVEISGRAWVSGFTLR